MMSLPNPSAWPEFLSLTGPWLALCAVFVAMSVAMIPRQRKVNLHEREIAEQEAARATRVPDRRSSRVRAVEEAEKQIILTPTTDEIICDVAIGAELDRAEGKP